MNSEFLIIAEELIRSEGRSLTPRELVNLAYERRLFSDKLSGKTPHKTMWEKLSRHIRRSGAQSVFVRTAPGRFYLRSLLTDESQIYDAPPLRPPSTSEDVLIFPSTLLDQLGRFQGIRQDCTALAKKVLTPLSTYYAPRIVAEQADDYKQVLTYVMVRRQRQVLAYKRGTYNRVEDFLRGSQCIGFGGHVSSLDRNLLDLGHMGLLQCATRELLEELNLPDEDRRRLSSGEGVRLVGVLNDDSSPVGRRHFAFLLSYEVSNDASWNVPSRGEKSITQLRWLDPASSRFSIWDFEYWSQLCFREYFPELVRTQPKYRIRRKMPLKPPHLLCVVGEIGSGKSEATRVLTEDFGYLELNSGRILAEVIGLPPVPVTSRSEFQKAAWRFISAPNGPRRLAMVIWQKVAESATSRVLLDGIRQLATLRELRAAAGSNRLGLLFVHTPPDIAYQFYQSRAGGSVDIYDFLRARDHPVEGDVRNMIGVSDAVLYNWTGRVSYQSVVKALMEEVGVTPAHSGEVLA